MHTHAVTSSTSSTSSTAADRPAEGHWSFGVGQPVQLDTSARRSRNGLGRVTAGRLVVGTDPAQTVLELTVAPAPRASARLLDELPQLAGGIELCAGLLSTSPGGQWHLTGLAVIGGEPVPASIEVWYQGVYRRAGVSAVWLSLRAQLELSSGRSSRSSRSSRRRRLTLSSELTAGPHLAVRQSAASAAAA